MDTLLTFVPTSLSFDNWKKKYSMLYSSVNELPPNVHLLTLEEWAVNSRNSVLLRLEHQVHHLERHTHQQDSKNLNRSK